MNKLLSLAIILLPSLLFSIGGSNSCIGQRCSSSGTDFASLALHLAALEAVSRTPSPVTYDPNIHADPRVLGLPQNFGSKNFQKPVKGFKPKPVRVGSPRNN